MFGEFTEFTIRLPRNGLTPALPRMAASKLSLSSSKKTKDRTTTFFRHRALGGAGGSIPARDGAVGHRVIAFEHRDLGGLLLREPVPLVVRTVGEARGLADAVVVDPVVGDVGLVGEGGPGAEHKGKLLDCLYRL